MWISQPMLDSCLSSLKVGHLNSDWESAIMQVESLSLESELASPTFGPLNPDSEMA